MTRDVVPEDVEVETETRVVADPSFSTSPRQKEYVGVNVRIRAPHDTLRVVRGTFFGLSSCFGSPDRGFVTSDGNRKFNLPTFSVVGSV